MTDPGELKALIIGLLGSVPGAFIVLDKRWHLVYLDHEAQELFLSKDKSLIGRSLEEVYPRQFGHLLAPQTIRGLLESNENTVTMFVNYFRKWFKVSAYSSDFGIFIRLEDVTRDMFSNRFLRLNQFTVDLAVEMIFWFKPAGHIIYANTASCNSLGFERKELASMMVADIDPSFMDNKWAMLVEDLKIKGSIVYESSLRSCNRSIIPVEVTCNYLVYHGEEYIIASARDITERNKAREELRHEHLDLEKKVADKTKELMSEKFETELYLDLMGHDISNMHHIALGYLELAKDMHPEADEDKFLEKSIEVLQRSSRLIQNVRKLQKIKEGVIPTHEVDVCKVLTDVQNEFGAIPHKAIILNMNGCEQCHVQANELLYDVFANLVSNAIKHTGDIGDIVVDMDIVKDNGSQYCRVIVEDNGPGIPDDFKTRIFNRTLKGTNNARGMGLGLYLVKSLVNNYKGRVWAEDRVLGDHTKGAKFVVMLPTTEK